VNFGTENWTHAFAQNGPTQVTIAIVAWGMRSRRMLLWKMILAAAALKGRKAGAQPANARVREIGKQALSGPFAGMEASLVEVSYPPGGRSAEHRHPGFIVGYVLEGQIRFALNHETPRVLRRGEMFYEPTGALLSTSENAQNASAAARYCSRENSRVTFTGTPATIAFLYGPHTFSRARDLNKQVRSAGAFEQFFGRRDGASSGVGQQRRSRRCR
jgi:quercetin dioxygenase-like cupin family protein